MNLESLLSPRSIAVIGASRDRSKLGHRFLANLVRGGYAGAIYPVNPRAQSIAGLRCYASVGVLPVPAELAVIALPAAQVPEIVQQCAQSGIRAAIVASCGFRETGSAGASVECAVMRVARAHDLRILGPGSAGVIVPSLSLDASAVERLPRAGGIGYFSQSGAVLAAAIDIAEGHRLGFSLLADIGSKADIDEHDLIGALGADPKTRVIAACLEGITSGGPFLRQIEQISRQKPVLLLSAGATPAGTRVAAAHTGSRPHTQGDYQCVFEQVGVVRCDSLEMQLDCARALVSQPLPSGRQVAVITNSGGFGVIAADTLDRAGLACARLEEQRIQRLRAQLPATAHVEVVIDLGGQATPEHYHLAVQAAMQDPGIQAVVVLVAPEAGTRSADIARALVADPGMSPCKPLMACCPGAGRVQQIDTAIGAGRVAWYDSVERAVDVIRAMAAYARWRDRPQRRVRLFAANRHAVRRIIDRHVRRGESRIADLEAREILEAYGFVTPRGEVATTSQQAVAIAEQLGYPVALKVWSPNVVHKSAVGGVRLGIAGPEGVEDAFDLMMYRVTQRAGTTAQILGMLVQRMVSGGQEVVLGMRRDAQLGPLIVFGMDSADAEVLQEAAFGLAPLTADDARQTLTGTRTYHRLRRTAGGEPAGLDAIAEAMQRLSQLASEFPQIAQVQIGPLVVGLPGGTPVAIDAQIDVALPSSEPLPPPAQEPGHD